jgi:hypothetical protein
MKSLLVACVSLLIVGCTAIPVKIKFPDVPKELQEPCPVLGQVDPKDHKLSSLLEVVTGNYALYYECKNRTDGWQQWYNEQRKIYESINK